MMKIQLKKLYLKLPQRVPLVVGLFLGMLVLLYSLISWLIPPAMFSDSGAGFMVLMAMGNGARFNHYFVPDPQDISRNLLLFQSWWSPGQYLVPGLFHRLGFNLGQSLTITSALFSSLGLIGCFFLYRKLGFSILVAALSCLVLGTSRMFALPFSIYNGGELLLFGAFGLIVWVFLKCESMRFPEFLLLPFLLLVGTFLKLSFGVCGIALMLALFWLNWGKSSLVSMKEIVSIGFKLGLIWGIYYGALYLLFLSKGATPGTSFVGYQMPATAFLFSLASPGLGAFSLGDLLRRTLMHPPMPYIKSLTEAPWLLALLAAFSLVLVAKAYQIGTANYRKVLISFFVIYVTVLSWFLITGAAISYDERHYRPASLILLPGIIAFLFTDRYKWIRHGLACLIVFCCCYGVFSFFVRTKRNAELGIGREGITQLTVTKGALPYLRQLDQKLPVGNNLFYLTSPEIALEIHQQRVMSSHADFETIEELKASRYKGKVDNLILVIPAKLVHNGKAEVIRHSFVDYSDDWQVIEFADTAFYYQGNLSRDQWLEFFAKSGGE